MLFVRCEGYFWSFWEDEDEVKEVIEETRGSGKEKLEKVFRRLGVDRLDDPEIKALLSSRIEKLPDEIIDILKLIKKLN